MAALLSKCHICVTFNSVPLRTDVEFLDGLQRRRRSRAKNPFLLFFGFFCFVLFLKTMGSLCLCVSLRVRDQSWPSSDLLGAETKSEKLDHLLTGKYFKKSESLFIEFNVCVWVYIFLLIWRGENAILFHRFGRFYMLKCFFPFSDYVRVCFLFLM